MSANTDKLNVIPNLSKFFVPFSLATTQPYVIDGEKAEAQMLLFTSEDKCKSYIENRRTNNGDPLRPIKVEGSQALQFFSTIFYLGIDEVLLCEDNGDKTSLAISSLIKKPDFSKLPEADRPVFNTELQLAGIKLMQEIHRNSEIKTSVRDLEDKMFNCLMKTKLIVVTAMLEDGEDPEDSENAMQIPCVQDGEGKTFQPVFTDTNELGKFVGKRRFQSTLMTFEEITKMINVSIRGIVINPTSLNIMFLTEKLPMLLATYNKDANN